MRLFRKSLIILFLFSTCCASLTWAQSSRGFKTLLIPDPLLLSCPGRQHQVNEFAYSGQPNGNFFCSPLMLEGVAFDYNAFTLESKGVLTLIKGDPRSGKVVEIPFYLNLRRNGKLLTHPCVIFAKAEISIILEIAQDGDELIVEPVKKEDWPAKRIIKIGGGC